MIVWRSATGIIAALTVIAFVVSTYIVGIDEAAWKAGFVPARLSGLMAELDAISLPGFLTPLTAAFLHSGFMHILFNMLILLFCGRFVEAALGWERFIILYIAGAYGAAAAQWVMDPAAALPMIGASGAVSAIFGAYAIGFGKPRPLVQSPALNRFLNTLWLLAAWIAIQWLIDLMAAMEGTLIATPAHVGGFVVGLLMFGILHHNVMTRHRNATITIAEERPPR
ncbi:rhomboid family intramembrane serine protease [Sphingomicrobium sediminis]|uniref:Rhomboid family intramembrane serine protease n=1 Tax=Sphingomicrobium sediminis TaxID=2950949 RepID=A0A9X2EG12_9SPHN|nr:rhomboid family intramembrane serine protease [Sphingomicrobium sediminis]MCM8556850.1 rhomboid family intramembrane serine protease [Sphingomicrobium sediminis]